MAVCALLIAFNSQCNPATLSETWTSTSGQEWHLFAEEDAIDRGARRASAFGRGALPKRQTLELKKGRREQ
jgi:hypothetical protein